MYSPQQVIDKLYQKGAELDIKNREQTEFALAFIEAERTYNVGLSAMMLQLKAEGNAISTCEKLAKGDTTIAAHKYEMDKQDILRDAAKRASFTINTKIDIMRTDISFKKEELKNLGVTQQG